MTKFDLLLIFAWLIFVIFLGPWLISAPSWIAVGLGFTFLGILLWVTIKRVKIHYE